MVADNGIWFFIKTKDELNSSTFYVTRDTTEATDYLAQQEQARRKREEEEWKARERKFRLLEEAIRALHSLDSLGPDPATDNHYVPDLVWWATRPKNKRYWPVREHRSLERRHALTQRRLGPMRTEVRRPKTPNKPSSWKTFKRRLARGKI